MSKPNGVIYLMTYPSHLVNLVVSLWTLRRWWTGKVTVYAWQESYDIAKRIGDDPALNANVILREPRLKGTRTDTFVEKTQFLMDLPEGIHAFLDADTVIAGPIDELFDAGQCGFAATQFNDWLTVGDRIKDRVKRLYNFPEIDRRLVDATLASPWPSPNNGIISCQPNSEVLPLWYRWTLAAQSMFIPDETVLHVLVPLFMPSGKMEMLRGGVFNCSPKHQPRGLPDDAVRIWHFHGDSNVRPEKTQRGFDMWWPLYLDARKQNVGGIKEWRERNYSKWLNKAEHDHADSIT